MDELADGPSGAAGRPLAGRHVIVTRPAGQAAHLAEALAALGAHPVQFPVLAISDLPDPSPILDAAIRLDTYNEELYRLAMRARQALGDREGIRHLLRALTAALSDLDAEPEESTVELARRLRSVMPAKGRPEVRE